MSDRPYNVLFLCTGNSARSIIAESILRKDGAGRFKAFSAGSNPSGGVSPLAVKVLDALDYPTDGLRTKSWDEYAKPDAPEMDFIMTVCDTAAGESCPIWPGKPITAHWGIEDPKTAGGTEIERERAFTQAARYLRSRISAFLSLPQSSIDHLALEQIGRMEGATRRVAKAN